MRLADEIADPHGRIFSTAFFGKAPRAAVLLLRVSLTTKWRRAAMTEDESIRGDVGPILRSSAVLCERQTPTSTEMSEAIKALGAHVQDVRAQAQREDVPFEAKIVRRAPCGWGKGTVAVPLTRSASGRELILHVPNQPRVVVSEPPDWGSDVIITAYYTYPQVPDKVAYLVVRGKE